MWVVWLLPDTATYEMQSGRQEGQPVYKCWGPSLTRWALDIVWPDLLCFASLLFTLLLVALPLVYWHYSLLEYRQRVKWRWKLDLHKWTNERFVMYTSLCCNVDFSFVFCHQQCRKSMGVWDVRKVQRKYTVTKRKSKEVQSRVEGKRNIIAWTLFHIYTILAIIGSSLVLTTCLKNLSHCVSPNRIVF